jgi:hypothetical protein
MAQSQEFYSNKDSNQNRKLEQFKSLQMRLISWAVAIISGVGFIYYYYFEMERPPLYQAPVSAPINMTPPAPTYPVYSKDTDSHPYNPYKTPYEQ